jgi:hypothetical protein
LPIQEVMALNAETATALGLTAYRWASSANIM